MADDIILREGEDNRVSKEDVQQQRKVGGGGPKETEEKKQITTLMRYISVDNITTCHLIMTNEDTITTTIPRLQFTKQGFRWRSADTWNLLPGDIRSTQSLPVFKRKVKNWIRSLRNPEPD